MNLWSIADYYDDRRLYLPQMKHSDIGKPMPQSSLFQLWLATSVVTKV